jgi:polyphosphate kinase
VSEIRMTAYRIAPDSQIAAALISAAKNGKKVTIFVELKARFDEANNIRWVKKMKEAGVNVVYSLPYLKVHAKVALIRYKKKNSPRFVGLLSTGNFNERTARIYTDHILLTARQTMLQELESLFAFLEKKKSADHMRNTFEMLLVAPFNLLQRFVALIDREIGHAKAGMPAKITIKLNNLEEEKLIKKLYDASAAGVEVQLLIRGICRLVPGVNGMSERISVRRILDRYLEHGRIFWFHNKGDDEIYLGSADWMNRNIYRRIEVCFPVHDPGLKSELQTLLQFQWEDNVQAVTIDSGLNNVLIGHPPAEKRRSQEEIYNFIRNRQSGQSGQTVDMHLHGT